MWYQIQPWLMTLLPVLLIIVFLVFLLRSRFGFSNFSGGRGRKAEIPTTRFSDVAGAEESVAELGELAASLSGETRFAAAGATMPKGVLLVGPPGVGKTLLARAMAGEAGVSFFALSGSDFVEAFVGVGAARVRRVFDRARKAKQAIVFIDELDAVGRARTLGPGNAGTDERERTLNQLLVEMDGFTGSGILVIGATNRADVLDPALVRPGRFDRHVVVPLPDRKAREAILRLHVGRLRLGPGANLESIARRTPGMSGADLANVVNEAAMEAGRNHRTVVESRDLEVALERIVMGRERRSAAPTERDRKVAAWHEAGHALCALLLPDAPDPVSVSIIPRGPAGGVTWMAGSDDQLFTKAEAQANLTVTLGGRAGEEILLHGDCTQGAASDLQSAAVLARAMVADFGMSDLGLNPSSLKVEKGVSKLVQEQAHAARSLLKAHKPALKALAEALLDQESLTVDEVRALVDSSL